MLKKIHYAMMSAAFALAPAPAALAEYERICLRVGTAGYAAAFRWAIGRRDNQDGLEPGEIRGNSRDGTGIGRIHAHQSGCFNLSDTDARPGDRLRFYVKAYGGKTVQCGPTRELRDFHEGFFLNPDGPREGTLNFYSSGTTLNHNCGREGGELRMHSECNATLDGMTNGGCAYWRPEITRDVLHKIVKNDQGLGMLGSALRRGARANGASDSGGTVPLHHAGEFNRAQYVRPLIDEGANIGARGAGDETPVMTAVLANHEDPAALREMLQSAPEEVRGVVNASRDDGSLPLHAAAEQNRTDVFDMLVEAGARVNLENVVNGETALSIAKRMGHQNIVNRLRQLGAREDVYDRMVYDIVSEDQGVSRLREALNREADPNIPGDDGKTALHAAAENNDIKYVYILTSRDDLDKNARDDLGRTPLMLAVESMHPGTALLREMIARGADINAARLDGNFPLYMAVELERLDIVHQIGFARELRTDARHPETNLTAQELAANLALANGGDFREISSFLDRQFQ